MHRLGEICLDPDVARAMILPLSTLSKLPVDSDEPCANPLSVLQYMDMGVAPDAYHSAILLERLFASYLPPHTLIQQTLKILAWKVETPPRVILYTGQEAPNVSFLPHALPKILLDERARRPDPSAIQLLPSDSTDELHTSILNYAQTALAPHYESVSVSKKAQGSKSLVLSHTLEEALACFVQPPEKNHTTIPLNQSPAWNKDHVDARYSETQIASNGSRYRDWLCVYANEKSIEKCKLDSHVLESQRHYQTRIPWGRPDSDQLEWINVRSSLPLESRVFRDSQAATVTSDRFTAFTRVVKSRMLQDLKLLPVLDPDHHVVLRVNTSVYTDEPSQQLLIVYSPSPATESDPPLAYPPPNRLQFISFSLLPGT